jgi:hypothetical protein
VSVQNPASFHDEARFQRACANCGATGAYHAHHVVDKQALRRKLGCSKRDDRLYDTRNALRLCDGLHGPRCHMNMEWGGVGRTKVPTKRLLDQNIHYAFEVLGPYAADYLRHEYDDTDPDPRILELQFKEPA